jgi:hypothetical protein
MKFKAGKNIAMKVPSHEFSQTVRFYKEIIGLPLLERESGSVVFQFGDKRLWIDRENRFSQAEIWLEIITDNIEKASQYLKGKGVTRRDRVEKLPEGFEGFWISNPADIIHLVSHGEDS